MGQLLKNQRGQAMVESILIAALLVTVAVTASKVLRDAGFARKMLETPWSYLAGMMENGVWMPADKGHAFHPNHIDRHNSPEAK